MPSTPTTRNRLEKQETGENFNTWGAVFSASGGSDRLDDALDGIAAYSLSGPKTLTSTNYVANEARMRVQNITGGTGGTVTIPTVEKVTLVRAGSSGTVTFSNGVNTLAVLAGNVEWMFTNGTDIYRVRTLDYGSDLLSTTGAPTTGAHLTNKTYVDAEIAAAVFDGLGSLGSGIGDFLNTPSSANLRAAITDETGTGALVFANSPTLVTPALGTPASGDLGNCTGYDVADLDGLGANVAAFLASPTSANLANAVTGETGSGALVFASSPALTDNPTAPTQSPGNNSTRIATTAFVTAAITAAAASVIYLFQAATYTLTSTTARQKLFNQSTNGTVTVAAGIYEYELSVLLASMSATSGNASVQITGDGTATISGQHFVSVAADGGVGTTTNAQVLGSTNVNSAAQVATGSTATNLVVQVKGVIRLTAAGTVIPSITLADAAAAVVQAGSYFIMRRLGDDTAYTAGTWS